MAKFDDNSDLIYHLEELKKKWNKAENGEVAFQLMEVVEGLEVAASAFFNGDHFLKNADGKVVGFLNFEEKKEADGNTGEVTGEMGTTFLGVTEDNALFSEILLKPEITRVLRKAKFRGVFDINCIKTKDGLVALEPTCRFGVPATSYEFIEGLDTPASKLIETVAKGLDKTIKIHTGVGMVMVIAAKPYPVEAEVEDSATSIGERLWLLKEYDPKHTHLENFYKDEGIYKVATKNGYLLTVTGTGNTIEAVRGKLIAYIKDNLYIAGMKYRSDIGARVEEYIKKNSDTMK